MKKTVLITGGSRGIGRMLALEFARSGYFVLINFKSGLEQAKKTLESIKELGGEGELRQFDVSKPAEVKEGVRNIIESHSGIDVLVNNAGIVRNRLISSLSEADWDDVIASNLSGPFYLVRELAKPMMKNGGGAVINISSIIGARGLEGCSNYAASKGGLVSFTKSAAKEFGRFGITVNAVLPGFHLTDMGTTANMCYIEKAKNESVLNTTTDINELARFIVFLAQAKTISGQVFNIDSRVL